MLCYSARIHRAVVFSAVLGCILMIVIYATPTTKYHPKNFCVCLKQRQDCCLISSSSSSSSSTSLHMRRYQKNQDKILLFIQRNNNVLLLGKPRNRRHSFLIESKRNSIVHPTSFVCTLSTVIRDFERSVLFSLTNNDQNNDRMISRKSIVNVVDDNNDIDKSHNDDTATTTFDYKKIVLSNDPYIYIIPNLLSDHECNTLIEYAMKYKNMTTSNPPAVSINLYKLWPLPLLSIFGGIPKYFNIIKQQENDEKITTSFIDILPQIVPNIIISFISIIILTFIIILPLIRQFTENNSRTSLAAALNQDEDIEIIKPLLHRIYNITKHPISNYEAPVITYYNTGGTKFALHNDASMNNGIEWYNIGGQRVMTCICYLNTVPIGGETSFQQLNVSVKPIVGNALFFYPATNNTPYHVDERTIHESLPTSNVYDKYIIQIFGRQNIVPYPLGLPSSFFL